jgi:hypothetical protein
MRGRWGLVLAVTVAVSAVAASSADSALFFLFRPTNARPGDQIVVRTGGTPADFKLGERVKPFQRPIRVYLIANSIAEQVHSPDDPRLSAVGSLIPDKNGNGVLSFRVPDLPDGIYAAAALCPACARFSSGRTFFTLPVGEDIVPRYRSVMLLRVKRNGSAFGWPSAAGLAVAIVTVVTGAAFLIRRLHSRSNSRNAAKPH